MEEKPVFIIIGALTVLIGLVPLLQVMDSMGEATTTRNDHQQLERLVGGINDECSGRSGFIELELQSGSINVVDNGEAVELTVADETETMEPEDCQVEFAGSIENGIDAGDTTVSFSSESSNLVEVSAN